MARDSEFLNDSDGSDISMENEPTSKGKGKASARKGKTKPKMDAQAYTWEAAFQRSWDTVQEDEAGSLQRAVEDSVTRARRKRLLFPSVAIRRTIIRHVILLLDLSSANYAREFIVEWFDQNPLGQIGIVGMRAGVGERICGMTGNVQDVLKSISERHKLSPSGEPSLQNAIEIARNSMNHLPTHSSREIIIIFGSLTTCDPGSIHDTLDSCIKTKVRISVVALAAEMKICRELCDKTGGQFGVAMNEGHFKDLLFDLVPPPAQRALSKAAGGGGSANSADLMMIGFPKSIPDAAPAALCVCHSELKSHGYLCPRCLAKVCDVPTDCDICGLMIVSSPHLARSYHHLFPVKTYSALTSQNQFSFEEPSCHACARIFQTVPSHNVANGVSPFGRYRCPDCNKDFCSECDVFVHDVLHKCPGCAG
ncbi:Ssl1-like-domain-containing protein [Flagelloscypha sp. PMI_526]|nr:Ssl1-like-domain-containing protein [Flagelloscypha sp. PMI_526]